MRKNGFAFSVLTIASALILTLQTTLCAQTKERGNYIWPVEQKQRQLSSNFGKQRVNRFHSGLDFRTGGVEGLKVRAVADGYVYRIGIKPYGYGYVLYIRHNDGKSTVYGHLREFAPEIAAYVRKEQYRQKANSIDLYLSGDKFPVRQGDFIGYSGNSGYSSGPHLHFEIRDAATEKTLNVIAMGVYDIADNIPPEIVAVNYYVTDTIMGIPLHTHFGRYAAVKERGGVYRLASRLKLPDKGYFTIEAYDRKNDVGFNMAIYRITERVDDRKRFEFVMDGFFFNQSIYAQAVAQYAENKASEYDIYRLAVPAGGSSIPFYRNVVSRGRIDPAKDSKMEIEVEDDNGNVSVLRFEIVSDPSLRSDTVAVPMWAAKLDCAEIFRYSAEGATVIIPANTLYEPVFYKQSKMPEAPVIDKGQSTLILSDFHSLHNESVPLNSAFTLSIDADVPEELCNKVVLARLVKGGKGANRLAAVSAKYNGGRVTGKATGFGTWCVAADTIPPIIKPSFPHGADLSKASSLSFTISDNLSGIYAYSAEIDGQWVILDHATVKSRLVHYFDDELSGKGKTHAIKLTVIDGVGNESVYEGAYYR